MLKYLAATCAILSCSSGSVVQEPLPCIPAVTAWDVFAHLQCLIKSASLMVSFEAAEVYHGL